MNTTIAPVSKEDAERWATGLQDRLANHWLTTGNHGDAPTITLEHGPRWIRIVRTQGSSRSAYGFIDQTTGTLYKAAGWKAPAKGARGSVYSGYRGCEPYGMAYAR